MRLYYQFDSDEQHLTIPEGFPESFRKKIESLKEFVLGRFSPLRDDIAKEELENNDARMVMKFQPREPYINFGYQYSDKLKHRMIESLSDDNMLYITNLLASNG